jgi:large subunit ribosomal protein L21
MYAIVKTGGKQYRVERGQHLLVERLAVEEGASVALQPLMYRSDETVFAGEGLEQVQVTAKVLGHERGEKLRVVKFKPKRGYKRRNGHRQELTRIEITEIALGGKGGARKAAKAAAAETPVAAAKPQASEPTSAESGAAQASKAPKEATEDGA